MGYHWTVVLDQTSTQLCSDLRPMDAIRTCQELQYDQTILPYARVSACVFEPFFQAGIFGDSNGTIVHRVSSPNLVTINCVR